MKNTQITGMIENVVILNGGIFYRVLNVFLTLTVHVADIMARQFISQNTKTVKKSEWLMK